MASVDEPVHTLYVGVAAPLIESGQAWLAEIPDTAGDEERRAVLKAFPHAAVGAYGLDGSVENVIEFKTGAQVPDERVRELIRGWAGADPVPLAPVFRPVAP